MVAIAANRIAAPTVLSPPTKARDHRARQTAGVEAGVEKWTNVRQRQQRRGCEDEQNQPREARYRSIDSVRANPSPCGRQQQERNQVSRETNALKEGCGHVGPDGADPIVGTRLAGCIPRRIIWVIGKEAKKEQQSHRNQSDGDDLVRARVARTFDFNISWYSSHNQWAVGSKQ